MVTLTLHCGREQQARLAPSKSGPLPRHDLHSSKTAVPLLCESPAFARLEGAVSLVCVCENCVLFSNNPHQHIFISRCGKSFAQILKLNAQNIL